MPARRLHIAGHDWEVYPSGFLTQSVGDEFGLVFVTGQGDGRQVRVTRYAPRGVRSREQSLAELDEATLRRLFEEAQPGVRSPEAGYRA